MDLQKLTKDYSAQRDAAGVELTPFEITRIETITRNYMAMVGYGMKLNFSLDEYIRTKTESSMEQERKASKPKKKSPQRRKGKRLERKPSRIMTREGRLGKRYT